MVFGALQEEQRAKAKERGNRRDVTRTQVVRGNQPAANTRGWTEGGRLVKDLSTSALSPRKQPVQAPFLLHAEPEARDTHCHHSAASARHEAEDADECFVGWSEGLDNLPSSE